MLKEKETIGKFQNDIKNINFFEIEKKVTVANQEAVRRRLFGADVRQVAATVPAPKVGINVKQAVPEDLNSKTRIIGVHRTGALGDVILTTPIVRRLKELYPEKEIWISTICPDAYWNNPRVAKVVRSKGEIASDVIFDLDLVYEKDPKRLITSAYAEAVFGSDDFDLKPEMWSTTQNFVRARSMLSGIDFTKDKVIVIHMAVSWPNRTWPREKWMNVIRGLSAQNYRVVVIGRGSDFKADLYGGVYNLNDILNVQEIREVIRNAGCFVGMDSGMIHVAQTTSTPIVGMFTCAKAEYRISRYENVTPLIPSVDCYGCLHEQAPPVTFVGCKRGDLKCLTDITPEMVVNAIKKYF